MVMRTARTYLVLGTAYHNLLPQRNHPGGLFGEGNFGTTRVWDPFRSARGRILLQERIMTLCA